MTYDIIIKHCDHCGCVLNNNKPFCCTSINFDYNYEGNHNPSIALFPRTKFDLCLNCFKEFQNSIFPLYKFINESKNETTEIKSSRTNGLNLVYYVFEGGKYVRTNIYKGYPTNGTHSSYVIKEKIKNVVKYINCINNNLIKYLKKLVRK